MKIVVIGGTGLIGSRLVARLEDLGHMVVSASRSSGVNIITGEGLKEAFSEVDAVVDVSNAPWRNDATEDFFQRATLNLLAADQYARVKHHIVLSVVGADRLPESSYMRSKLAQEQLVKASGIPYTILRSTQFFELADRIAKAGTIGDQVHVSQAAIQPVAADDVVETLIDILLQGPTNDTIEIAGPVCMPMYELVRYYLNATEDPRQLVEDAQAPYYGAVLTDWSLAPRTTPRIGTTMYESWFRDQLVVQ